MLELSEDSFLGKGAHKRCYQHPEDPSKCIKISYSEEGKLKLSLARKGRLKTELHKLHISQGNSGKVRTAETKAKISKSKKGKVSNLHIFNFSSYASG